MSENFYERFGDYLTINMNLIRQSEGGITNSMDPELHVCVHATFIYWCDVINLSARNDHVKEDR